MLTPGQKAASVSELVAHVKQTLEETFFEVMVEGEITGISHAHSGHCYFNLMDEEASISCAFFRQDVLRHPGFKNIKEGDRVLVYGPLTVYQKRGSFQIQVKRVMPAGEGLWKLKFEALKKKLSSEGLFDPERKKTIPAFPRRIALITAPGGAALHDFLNVYERRSLGFEIVLIPALVQGDKAASSIIRAFNQLEKVEPFDVVVLTRGGGSPEDLWCFNDESLIRKMAECPYPIISAIGHEVDWTLSDHVADVRCETPTAAAETLTQPQTEVLRRLVQTRDRLVSHLKTKQAEAQRLLLRYHPSQLIGILRERLQEQTQRLEKLSLLHRVEKFVPINQRSMELDELAHRLEIRLQEQWQQSHHRLEKLHARMEALDPKKVLSRGYSMISSADGIISNQHQFKSLPAGEMLEVVFHDGAGQVQKFGDNK
jgi:exodeoxyribonuclease VII large subunit